jgi:hypothetical protein
MLMSVVMLSFVVLTTDGPSDPELHWVQGNVPYKFNDAGSADMGPEVYPAVEAGFQVWNDASGVDYSYAGCTSKGRGSVINGSGDASADGDSIITWIENSWPYGPSTIAITWTYFFEDGEIGEADMLMNGDDYNWTTSTAGGETDVASIAAHEAGHYLGLGHTNESAATMFATVQQGETSKRSLHADDIAGAQYIYGAGASSGNLFDGNCEGGGGGTGEGCACSLEGTGSPSAGLLAGILSVVAFALAGMMRLRRVAIPAFVRRRTAAAVVVALALFGARDASATVMIDQSLEQLAAESQAVVHGDVTSVETHTNGEIIWTVQQIRVRETLAGLNMGEVIEVVTPGGTLPKGVKGPFGYAGARAVGIPRFAVGEEVVVFVQPAHASAAFLTVTALQQGKLNVVRDAKGAATIVRDLSGVHRVERTEAGLEPVTGDPLSGIELESLSARIRVLPTRISPAIR